MNGVNRTHPSSGMIPIFGSGEYIPLYESFCIAEREYTSSRRLETKAIQFLDFFSRVGNSPVRILLKEKLSKVS